MNLPAHPSDADRGRDLVAPDWLWPSVYVRSGLQTRLARTAHALIGQAGADMLARFGGPAYIEREWDRVFAPGEPLFGDVLILDVESCRWAAPEPWWRYLRQLDDERVAAGKPSPVVVDPDWREPASIGLAHPAIDDGRTIDGSWS